MGIFDFFKTPPPPSFELQVEKIEGLSIVENSNSRIVEFSNLITKESIKSLLALLRENKIAFSFHDSLYPSASDPGAYIDYSQEQNSSENTWSMTLGNHGWSGGIYTIEEKNIVIQINNLVRNSLLNSIRIDNVKIFSHYDKQNIDFNRNQNALIYGIHSDIIKIDSNYLIFGLFSSDNYSPYNIFKLTKEKLFIDKRATWHSQRHTQKGYIFEGEAMFRDKFEIAKQLLLEIPLELVTKKWNGFYTTGNKNEDQLILEFENLEFHKTISIDSYEIETENLPLEIKNYRQTIEKIVRKLND